MKKIVMTVVFATAMTVSAASAHLSLDNRTGTRVAAATERICFSPAWETDAAGATAVVSVNGVAVKTATEAGVYEWTPAQDGIYQLTHAVYVNGVQVGEMLSATFLEEDYSYRRAVDCSFLAQYGEPQDEFDVTKAFAVLYKKVNGQYVEIGRSGRQFQTFTVGNGTYRIEFQYADDTWVAANYSTELTVSRDSPSWTIKEEGRYIKAVDTWSLWVQLYANEGDKLPYAERYYRGDARNWDETLSMATDPTIKIPLSDLNWPLWALQNEEEIEWYEYDAIDRKSGPRMFVNRIAGRRCFEIWKKDVPDHVLRLVAKKKTVKKTVPIKFGEWKIELFSFWAFAPEGTTTESYVSPTIRDGERTEESFTVEDCEGVSFVWKTSCEDAAADGPQRDHGEFLVDGKVVATRAGESDWSRVSIDFEDTGSHTITWRYVKDASGSSGGDCMWVACINVESLALEDPIPDIGGSPSAVEVYDALEGSADSKLQVNITVGEDYNAYRDWAMRIGAAEVKASPYAWVSFATDSAALLAKMPTDEDLKVDEFKPSATAGSFDFTVSVKDVTIGDKASENNLKRLFGLEGAESLGSAMFSSENVSLDFKEPQDGKLKFTATPAVDNAQSFFMKVKILP